MEEAESPSKDSSDGTKEPQPENEIAKRARIRTKVITEIMDSERTYQHHLELVIQYFEGPLHDLNLVPDHVIVTIFSNIRQIVSVNQELVEHLQQIGVGQAFLRMGPFFKLYSTYANNHERALAAMIEWEQKRPEFGIWRRQQEEEAEMMGLKMNSLLITPVQRIPRYKLLLEDLLQNTEKSHEDYSSIEEAAKQIGAVASHINEHIRQHDNFNKMLAVQKSLNGPGAPRILTPGRIFIKDGPLKKVSKKGGRSHERMFFLFSDILLYAKPKFVDQVSGSYVCCCVFPLHHCKVDTVFGHSQSSGSLFTVTCKNESLLLYSDLKSVQSWVNILRKSIGDLHDCRQTLRKPSSALQPLRRPGLVQLRKQQKKKDPLEAAKRTPDRVSHSPRSIKRAFAEANINCLTPRKRTKGPVKDLRYTLNSATNSAPEEPYVVKSESEKKRKPSQPTPDGSSQKTMAKKFMTHIRQFGSKQRERVIYEKSAANRLTYTMSPEPKKQGPDCDIDEILDPEQPKWDIFDTALPDDSVVWRSRLDTDPPDMERPVPPPRRTHIKSSEDSDRRPCSEISENTSRIWKGRPDSEISDDFEDTYNESHVVPPMDSDSDLDSPVRKPGILRNNWRTQQNSVAERDSMTVYSHSSRDFLSKYAFDEDGSPQQMIYHKQSESMLIPYRTQWSTPSPPRGRDTEEHSRHSVESEERWISPEPDIIPESWRSRHPRNQHNSSVGSPTLSVLEPVEEDPTFNPQPVTHLQSKRQLPGSPVTPLKRFKDKYGSDLSPWKVLEATGEAADQVLQNSVLMNGNTACCIQ